MMPLCSKRGIILRGEQWRRPSCGCGWRKCLTSATLIREIPLVGEGGNKRAAHSPTGQNHARYSRRLLVFSCTCMCVLSPALASHWPGSLSPLFAAVQSLNSLNDQIAQFMVTKPCTLADEDETFMPGERNTLRKSMTLMRHLLVDAQVRPPLSRQGHKASTDKGNLKKRV